MDGSAGPPPPTFPKALITLNDLIGELPHLQTKSDTMNFKDLSIKYWIYSNPDHPLGPTPPVIAIHGGPATPHNYLLPLKLLAHLGYPVIFYDQAGCGESTWVEDPATTHPHLLTLEYYINELEALISHLQLDEFFLYGSSWGSMLAQEYAIKHHENLGLLGMILDGPLCDPDLYIKTQRRDRHSTLPTFTQNLIAKLEKNNQYEDPKYHELNDTLSTFFTCRLIPKPDCYLDCFPKFNKKIYVAMQGASEFTIGGALKDWNITEQLKVVTIPTLVMVGEYDTMTVECGQQIVDLIGTAFPLVVVPRAGHLKLCDEPQLCCQHTLKFLNTIQSIRKQQQKRNATK